MKTDFLKDLYQNVEKNPSKTVLVEPGGRSIRYGELKEAADLLSGYLKNKGIIKGTKILVLGTLSINLYILLAALFKIGAVSVFIDPWAEGDYIDNCLLKVDCDAVVFSKRASPVFLKSRKLRAIRKRMVLKTIIRESRKAGIRDGDLESIDYEETALLTFTTGSISKPKGFDRTRGFLIAQHEAYSRYLKQDQTDRQLVYYPIPIISNLVNGYTSVIPAINIRSVDRVNCRKLFAQMIRENITSLTSSPSFLQKLVEYGLNKKISIDKIRSIYVVGAPAGLELFRRTRDVFPKAAAWYVYGSTEADPISLLNFDAFDEKICRQIRSGQGIPLGRPVPEIECKTALYSSITSGSFTEAPPEVPGEIILSGEYVGKKYFNNDEAFRATKILIDGKIWHRTFDIGTFDREGVLWFLGRKNSILYDQKGERYPVMAEPAVDELPFVRKSGLFQYSLKKKELGLVVSMGWKDRLASIFNRRYYEEEIRLALNPAGLEIKKILLTLSVPLDPRHRSKIDYEKLLKRYSLDRETPEGFQVT